jgi:steroid delta-isomerase-like uncharacterized protein
MVTVARRVTSQLQNVRRLTERMRSGTSFATFEPPSLRADSVPLVTSSELEPAREVIAAFYTEVWNGWDVDAAYRLLDPGLTFRGSLGRRTNGLPDFLEYVAMVRNAFPDFHNRVELLVVDGPHAVARVTYTGTHRGPILGYEATGRKVAYEGIAWFTLHGGRITSGFVLGDVDGLRAQLA